MDRPSRTDALAGGAPSHEVVFVLDRSCSMQGGAFDDLRKAAAVALRRLHPKVAFNVVDFGSRVSELFPQSVLATPANVDLALRHVTQGAAAPVASIRGTR